MMMESIRAVLKWGQTGKQSVRQGLVAALTIGALLIFAEPAVAQPAAGQFQKGDTVAFIGDSITHGGSYTAQILLYYATRFPDRKFTAYNCGISGDTASGALLRYAWDIEPHHPTVATIMLGMNDVGRNSYGKNNTGPEVEKQRQRALTSYNANMTKLSETLANTGCKLIFITPSIYDQTGTQTTTNLYGVNDALAICGEDGRKLAARFNGGVVDFHTLMTGLNAEQQKKDPAFTIVGPDRVHPGEVGHLVMAYELLKAQGVPAFVSDMAVDAKQGKAVKQENCQISDLKAANGGVSFACQEHALPFPVASGAQKALDLVPFTAELNREVLTVAHLAPGTYEIVIDGQTVQTCSAEELQAGVNLATNPKTPQYKQAAKVMELNTKRHVLITQQLRTIAAVKHFILERANPKPTDAAAEATVLEQQLEKNKKANFTYGVWQVEQYKKYKPTEKQIAQEVDEAWEAMWVENQPKLHRFEIRKL